MSTLLGELRYALRALGRTPAFTAAAVSTLALGMVFFLCAAAVTRAYLLRDLPYPAAERLYWVRYGEPGVPGPREKERLDWRSLADVVEHRVAWDLDAFFVLGGEHAEAVSGAWVTRGFLDALGVSPAIGHGLDESAFRPGQRTDVLISHRLWHARFGGRVDIVGHQFDAYVSDRSEETERFTIAGVLPERFWHLNAYTDILAPLRADTFPYMVRLRPGVAPDVVGARVTSLVAAGARDVPGGWSARLEPVHEAHVQRIRPTLRVAMAAGAMVLLVACGNVAGLLLLRAERRRHEVAVRAALGAGRLAVARLLAVEGVVLGVAATGVAVLVASLALDAAAPALEQQIGLTVPGGPGALAVDRVLVGWAALAGLATALACTAAPLATFARGAETGLRAGRTRTSTDGRSSRRFRTALVTAEIALSLALLSGAGLMLRSVRALATVDLGMQTDGVMSGTVTLRQARYPDATARAAVLDRITGRLAAHPAVTSVAVTSMWPMQQPQSRRLRADGGAETPVPVQAVTPGYFRTLHIGLRSGRGFADSDREGAAPVAVVSESAARRLWPGTVAVGRRVMVPPPTDEGDARAHTVVGVVADVRQGPLDEDQTDVYVPYAQEPRRSAFLVMRSLDAPPLALARLRAVVREVDRDIALDRVVPLQSLADQDMAGARTLAATVSLFSIAAGLLALVGLYGAIAYAVRQREREIAVRVAIGADPGRIVGLFVREGGLAVAAGLALGLAGALAGGRVLESQLFGVTPRDPVALGVAAAAFGAAALVATWWPARRAAVTDPAIALRAE